MLVILALDTVPRNIRYRNLNSTIKKVQLTVHHMIELIHRSENNTVATFSTSGKNAIGETLPVFIKELIFCRDKELIIHMNNLRYLLIDNELLHEGNTLTILFCRQIRMIEIHVDIIYIIEILRYLNTRLLIVCIFRHYDIG